MKLNGKYPVLFGFNIFEPKRYVTTVANGHGDAPIDLLMFDEATLRK